MPRTALGYRPVTTLRSPAPDQAVVLVLVDHHGGVLEVPVLVSPYALELSCPDPVRAMMGEVIARAVRDARDRADAVLRGPRDRR